MVYVEAEACGFSLNASGSRVTRVHLAEGTGVDADACVITAGAWSSPVGALLGADLPVRARKRDVFAFEADVDLRDAPLLIDPSGVWFRPEVQRGRFLCGSPPRDGDPDDVPLDQVDHGLFEEFIWPRLAERVPAFEHCVSRPAGRATTR